MSRSDHDGHGRCGTCGDAGAPRRAREDDAAAADEREDPDPRQTAHADAKIDRADEPAGLSEDCLRETCQRWRPCTPCATHDDTFHADFAEDLHADCEQCTGYPEHDLPSHECAACGASFLNEEDAVACALECGTPATRSPEWIATVALSGFACGFCGRMHADLVDACVCCIDDLGGLVDVLSDSREG